MEILTASVVLLQIRMMTLVLYLNVKLCQFSNMTLSLNNQQIFENEMRIYMQTQKNCMQ